MHLLCGHDIYPWSLTIGQEISLFKSQRKLTWTVSSKMAILRSGKCILYCGSTVHTTNQLSNGNWGLGWCYLCIFGQKTSCGSTAIVLSASHWPGQTFDIGPSFVQWFLTVYLYMTIISEWTSQFVSFPALQFRAELIVKMPSKVYPPNNPGKARGPTRTLWQIFLTNLMLATTLSSSL